MHPNVNLNKELFDIKSDRRPLKGRREGADVGLGIMVDGFMGKRKQRPGGPPSASRPLLPGGRGGGEWVFGVHAVTAALANPRRRLRRLLATAATAERLQPPTRSLPVEVVERAELDRILPANSVHQGVAALCDPLEPASLEEVLDATAPTSTVVVLDQATDPHNVGAVLRSAAAFGAAAVILPERHASSATGIVAKAASGALETVPLVHVVNLARTLDSLKEAGFWCVGLDGAAATDLRDIEKPARTAVVLGSEGEGLRRLTRERCDFLVRIPISGKVESLNLSNAAAVALYELAARR